MARSTYVVDETGLDEIHRELWVLYEETLTAEGEPGACLVRVDDELTGAEHVEGVLNEEDRAAIEEEIGLPLVEERYMRNRETGAPMRVCYTRRARRDWIGGKGYVYTPVVHVWNPQRGTLEEAGEAAAPGEQFALVLTEAQFTERTKAAQDLPPMQREEARRELTARPGEEQVCKFVKRTTGELRRMRFRYDPEKASPESAPFDAEAKGLLPVWDLDKQAARFVNLDGVRTIGATVAA